MAAGRWFPNGSNVEEGDVDMPSEESIIRQILYGNQFYRREFGVASDEFMIPDCFGFPASLPSIFAHCGLTGFSTQKLTWGSAVGIPFNVGVWEGTDGQSVIAALNPGSYTSSINDDLSHDKGWIQRVDEDGKKVWFLCRLCVLRHRRPGRRSGRRFREVDGKEPFRRRAAASAGVQSQ